MCTTYIDIAIEYGVYRVVSISGSEGRWKRGVECTVINVVPPAQRVIIRAVFIIILHIPFPPEIWTPA